MESESDTKESVYGRAHVGSIGGIEGGARGPLAALCSIFAIVMVALLYFYHRLSENSPDRLIGYLVLLLLSILSIMILFIIREHVRKTK